jgi:serine/threonine protein kinase
VTHSVSCRHLLACLYAVTARYGEVWSAAYSNLTVAVKLLKRAGGAMADDPMYASAFAEIDANTAAEFRKECEALQMIRHPNLLIFFGAGKTFDGRFFLVTELLSGGPLRKALLDTEKEITWELRTRVAKQIAQGMQHLHSLSMVHRDLKVLDHSFTRTLLNPAFMIP